MLQQLARSEAMLLHALHANEAQLEDHVAELDEYEATAEICATSGEMLEKPRTAELEAHVAALDANTAMFEVPVMIEDNAVIAAPTVR